MSIFKGKNIFVTGGRTGFLGVNFANALLDRGATVYACSRDKGKFSLLKPRPELIEFTCDLRHESVFPENIHYVFHCAGSTSGAKGIIEDPAAQIVPDMQINTNLLYNVALAGVEKFVFISSTTIYPESDVPVTEEMGFIKDPADVYFGIGWMKRCSEKLAEFYYKRYGMEVLIIRPSNIYGPYDSFDLNKAHVLPALIRKFTESKEMVEVWGSPDVVRDFIFVDDFVCGVLAAFESFVDFEVYNIASGKVYTVNDAVNIIAELTNYKGTIRYDNTKPVTIFRRLVSITKAEQHFMFSTPTSFREGIYKTIQYYKTLKADVDG